nr:MAG TPA: hypothetical protein [Caudoviricetes sp.]
MLNRTHVLFCLPIHTFIHQNVKQYAIFILHSIQHIQTKFPPNFSNQNFHILNTRVILC